MLVLTDVCQPGTKALDYVFYRDTATMKRMNVSVVLRYLVKTGNLNKALQPDEVTLLHNDGIGIIGAFERATGTPLKGYDQGTIDGIAARDAAAIIGYPQGLPIVASIDIAVTPANVAVVRSYLLGFRDALHGHYQLGIYGGTVIIKACLDISVCNQVAGAKSWSSNPPYPGVGLPIHFVQHISGSTPQYDMNDVILQSQMWLPHNVPDNPPAGGTVMVETIEVLETPERVYDSTDPHGPNPMQPLTPRDINVWADGRDWGGTIPTVAIIHVTAFAKQSGTLLFYIGGNPPTNNGRLTVASIALTAGSYCQSLVLAPVVNGNQVCAVSDVNCDLWFDLDGVGR